MYFSSLNEDNKTCIYVYQGYEFEHLIKNTVLLNL